MKVEERERAKLNVEEGVRLSLESRRRSEEEGQHIRLKTEEEARIIEEERLKSEEEDLGLKCEDEDCLVEETRLKAEQEDQARLKAERRHALLKTQGRKQRIMSMYN